MLMLIYLFLVLFKAKGSLCVIESDQYLSFQDFSDRCVRQVDQSVFVAPMLGTSTSEMISFTETDLPYSCSVFVRSTPGAKLMVVISSPEPVERHCTEHNSQVLLYESSEYFGGYWVDMPRMYAKDDSTSLNTDYVRPSTQHYETKRSTSTEIMGMGMGKSPSGGDNGQIVIRIVENSELKPVTSEETLEENLNGYNLNQSMSTSQTEQVNYEDLSFSETNDTGVHDTTTSSRIYTGKKRTYDFNYLHNLYKTHPVPAEYLFKTTSTKSTKKYEFQRPSFTNGLLRRLNHPVYTIPNNFQPITQADVGWFTTNTSRDKLIELMEKIETMVIKDDLEYRNQTGESAVEEHTHLEIKEGNQPNSYPIRTITARGNNEEKTFTNSPLINEYSIDPNINAINYFELRKAKERLTDLMNEVQTMMINNNVTFKDLNVTDTLYAEEQLRYSKAFESSTYTNKFNEDNTSAAFFTNNHSKESEMIDEDLLKINESRQRLLKLMNEIEEMITSDNKTHMQISGTEFNDSRIKALQINNNDASPIVLIDPKTHQKYSTETFSFSKGINRNDKEVNLTTDVRLPYFSYEILDGDNYDKITPTIINESNELNSSTERITEYQIVTNIHNNIQVQNNLTILTTYNPLMNNTQNNITKNNLVRGSESSTQEYIEYKSSNTTTTERIKNETTSSVLTTGKTKKTVVKQARSDSVISKINKGSQKNLNISDELRKQMEKLVDHKSWDNVVHVAPNIARMLNQSSSYLKNVSKRVKRRLKRGIAGIIVDDSKPRNLSQPHDEITPRNRMNFWTDLNIRYEQLVEPADDYIYGRMDSTQMNHFLSAVKFNICSIPSPKMSQAVLLNTSNVLISINNFSMPFLSIVVMPVTLLKNFNDVCPSNLMACQVDSHPVCIPPVAMCPGVSSCSSLFQVKSNRLLCADYSPVKSYTVSAVILIIVLLIVMYTVYYWIQKCVPKVSEAFFVYSNGTENRLLLDSVMKAPYNNDGSKMAFHDPSFDENVGEKSPKKKRTARILNFFRFSSINKSNEPEIHAPIKPKFSFAETEIKKALMYSTKLDMAVQTNESLEMQQQIHEKGFTNQTMLEQSGPEPSNSQHNVSYIMLNLEPQKRKIKQTQHTVKKEETIGERRNTLDKIRMPHFEVRHLDENEIQVHTYADHETEDITPEQVLELDEDDEAKSSKKQLRFRTESKTGNLRASQDVDETAADTKGFWNKLGKGRQKKTNK